MERRQILVFGGIFTAVLAVLALVWFAFLRPSYGMLYEDLREADAAEIVGVLDKQGIRPPPLTKASPGVNCRAGCAIWWALCRNERPSSFSSIIATV